ncbi:MAG: hypothetical protein PHX80_04590 [Candidatus Nanoarchaeia archaeon]|nr:hypothetical protein [Candidatus Nanoarchaeia archaeon]
MIRLEELKLEHEKRMRQLKNADPVQVGFLNKAIARIEEEMAELETPKEPELKEIDIIVDGKKLKFNKAGVANIPYKSLLKRVDLSHYIIMYGSDTGKDAELVYKDGKWNISCCDLSSSPEFVYEELGMAVTYMIEFMHDKYTHPETIDVEGAVTIEPEEKEIPIKAAPVKKKVKKVDIEGEDIKELKNYLTILQELKENTKSKVASRQIESEMAEVQEMINELS